MRIFRFRVLRWKGWWFYYVPENRKGRTEVTENTNRLEIKENTKRPKRKYKQHQLRDAPAGQSNVRHMLQKKKLVAMRYNKQATRQWNVG